MPHAVERDLKKLDFLKCIILHYGICERAVGRLPELFTVM